jgi:glutamine synthetase
MDGLESKRELPAPVDVNPSSLSEGEAIRAGVERLQASTVSALTAFEAGHRVQDILGPELTEALLAVRRHERTAFADASVDRYSATRFAWST